MDAIQEFIKLVHRMQWSDYLDIIVVAVLIYKLLPLIRTPNVMRIAKTVIALVLVTWITDELDLYTLNWILDQVLAIGLLAFVVLFQPELRYMLMHLGDMRIGRLFGFTKPVQAMDRVITQTVNACKTMSEKHCGALIVFDRGNELNSIIQKGVIIDGQVSEQLLRTIFFLNTDLHDKAVVIQNGRIAAARCKLPDAEEPMPLVVFATTSVGFPFTVFASSKAAIIAFTSFPSTLSTFQPNAAKRSSTES